MLMPSAFVPRKKFNEFKVAAENTLRIMTDYVNRQEMGDSQEGEHFLEERESQKNPVDVDASSPEGELTDETLLDPRMSGTDPPLLRLR